VWEPKGIAERQWDMKFDAECTPFHELISARFDNELGDEEEVRLTKHLASCIDCTSLVESLGVQHRMLRVRAVDAIPDLASRVIAFAHPPRLGRRGWVRQALAVIGLTELVIAIPALILGDDSGAPAHIARHVGSLGAALGFALLYVAWKPTRAYGLLPFVASLAAFMSLSSIFDLMFNRASLGAESTHLVEFAGMFFVWLLAGSPRPRIPRFAPFTQLFG
jgi:predicted anti-sigma-YlaC factor YlaD